MIYTKIQYNTKRHFFKWRFVFELKNNNDEMILIYSKTIEIIKKIVRIIQLFFNYM